MRTMLTPFNIKIIPVVEQTVSYMVPVTSLDIYDGATNIFNPEGLFSTKIFGKLNTEQRITAFSYIDIKIPIFHPKYFIELSKIKRLYGEIILGTSYAIWDDEIMDFRPSDLLNGETGFHFFTKHFNKITFTRNKSPIRESRVDFLETYKDKCLTKYILVIPAGYRDIETDREGRTKTPVINKLYTSLLSTVNSLGNINLDDANSVYYNTSAINIQKKFIDIYKYITSNFAGKRSKLSKSWARRNVTGGVRNVIVAADNTVYDLDKDGTSGVNNTHVGLYQYLKMYQPFVIHDVTTGFLQQYLTPNDQELTVINPKTKKLVDITYNEKKVSDYQTVEGVAKLINKFSYEEFRNSPVNIDGFGVALVYRDDKYFKVFQNIQDFPRYLNPDNVHLLTHIELFYIGIIKSGRTEYTTNTRYPAINEGSQYDSYAVPRTTVKSYYVTELGHDWEPILDGIPYPNFPDHSLTAAFFNAMSPNSSHLPRLSGDFDGDQDSKKCYYCF